VSFVIGCSFSFEQALMRGRPAVAPCGAGRNVAMYRTSIPTVPAGPFRRPDGRVDAADEGGRRIRAVQVTSRFPDVHGAPVHMGDPALIGIADLARPTTATQWRCCPTNCRCSGPAA
jgi:uncharacterized protein YcsI (UPF0317 family)